MQPSSSPPLSVNSSQVPAETDEAAIPPRPIARSVVQSAGLSFMQAKPFTVSGILTTGYYSAYTRGGSNSTQRINFIPASADFNVNGYFLTPDLIDYSFQPELNASPQANDAGFQGGNGIRMRINTLRRQPFPVSLHREIALHQSANRERTHLLPERRKYLEWTSGLVGYIERRL